MANFDPAFDKMIRNEGGPLESTVMKREDGMDDIFGYTFDEISLAQQGGRLGRVIDTSKPTLDESATEESDLKLLAQYGERKLRDMGYMAVIDRLERGGHLRSSEATIPAQGPVDVIVGRLRTHAEAHEYIANADPEQRRPT